MKKYARYVISFLIILCFIIFMVISSKQVKEYSSNLFYMDTYINVKIYSDNSKKVKQAFSEVDRIYKKYHQLSDRYNEYEGINNVYYINNNNNKNLNIVLDKDLYSLLKYGVEWYEKSNHLLNINLGNVIDVWKKYRDAKSGIPTLEELKNSGSNDIKNVVLLDNNSILNNHPNIDLGALSKGYTTELVGQYLKDMGFSQYLINAGGNVLVADYYKDGQYKIGIEDPTKTGEIYQVIKGENICVITSGSYERFYEYNGNLYHHIIDPTTLIPPNYMKSVTIVTNDSALGDALSTILFLMTIEDGKEYIKQFNNVEVIWFTNSNEIVKSAGFSKYE